MHTIVDRQELTKRDLISLTLEAPQIARKIRPGQFVILRVNETGRAVAADRRRTGPGQRDGHHHLPGRRQEHDACSARWTSARRSRDLCRPARPAEHIERFGPVVCIGGGVGIAPCYPIVCAMKAAGNRVTTIISARSKDLLILEDEMRALCDELKVATDDGWYGVHGWSRRDRQADDGRKEKIDLVIAVGPVSMMRAVCQVTRPAGIKTDGEPQPDHGGRHGHVRRLPRAASAGRRSSSAWTAPTSTVKVDCDELIQRNSMYGRDERISLLTSIKAR